MAAPKAKILNTDQPKMTPAQMRKRITYLEDQISDFRNNTAWCYMCGDFKRKDRFYISTNPMINTGIAPICKECAKKIALRVDENGDEHEPTKESIIQALRYLDKPFLENIYTSSVQEVANLVRRKTTNVWASYMKNISMPNYYGMTFADSDFFKTKIKYEDELKTDDIVAGHESEDQYQSYVKNKEDVIRLLGYDPFDQESMIDQPFLYSQLLGLLDSSEDANDDMMRTASAISIVRAFLQQSKIDNAIATYMTDVNKLQNNAATIKSLQSSKKELTSVIKDLAAENCISLKHSKDAKKGENTWTGKLKKIKDIDLREGKINGFDIETCKGMQQVADISMSAILKSLHYDESEWSDMVAEQRKKIVELTEKSDSLYEAFRILLQENLDLRDTLEDHDLLDKNQLKDLDDVINTYVLNRQNGDNNG